MDKKQNYLHPLPPSKAKKIFFECFQNNERHGYMIFRQQIAFSKVFFNPPHIGLYLGCLSGHSLSIVLTGGGGGTELGLPNPETIFI